MESISNKTGISPTWISHDKNKQTNMGMNDKLVDLVGGFNPSKKYESQLG